MPTFDRLRGAFGLPVFVAPHPGIPLVEIGLLLDAGGERNPLGQPGLASMTAAMLDEGTERHSGPELAAELERRGGALSCHADWNAARIRIQLLAADLEYGLALVGELLTEPAFPQHELDRLRQQTLAELQRRADQPSTVADETFARQLFSGTVFATPLAGNPDALRAMTREQLIDFHRRRYRLAGAALVVAGDFDPGRLAESVDRHLPFGPAKARSAPPESPAGSTAAVAPGGLSAAATGHRILVVDRPGAEQTEIRVGHLGVPRTHPDRTALGVLNTLLGGKFTSRINLNLRERHGYTYGASSRFVDRRSSGPFVVSAAVTTDATGRAVSEVLGEMRRIRDEPVAESELAATRSYLLGIFAYGLQTVEGLAARLDDIALYDLPLDTPARALAEVARVTTADLQRLAVDHLAPETALIVAVGPAEELRNQLAALGEPEIVTRAEP
ncbi:MAG: pitrilysin family protein [Thermoanaerobaculia bacterium]